MAGRHTATETPSVEEITAAQTNAETIAGEAGSGSLAYARALIRLADLQRRSGDFRNAEQGFAQAIAVIETRSGTLSEQLIEPLTGLGLTFAAEGDHARAVPLFARVLQAIRRNRGLFDSSQLGTLRQLASSLTEIGSYAEAEQTLRYGIRAAEQAYGPDDPRVASTISDLAQWYSVVRSYDIARSFYRTAIDRVEKHAGRHHPALVEPLLGLAANSMRAFVYGEPEPGEEIVVTPPALIFEHIRDSSRPGDPRRLTREGERALRRAISILENDPDYESARALIDALLLAGDWHLVQREYARAHAFYARAWRTNQPAASQSSATLVEDLLVRPVLIFSPLMADALRDPRGPNERSTERRVRFRLSVATTGRVDQVEVITAETTERKTREIVSALKHSIYRPRYVDGAAARAIGIEHSVEVAEP